MHSSLQFGRNPRAVCVRAVVVVVCGGGAERERERKKGSERGRWGGWRGGRERAIEKEQLPQL
jgi:hypothetical protein